MKLPIVLASYALLATPATSLAADPNPKLERWDRAVYLRTESPPSKLERKEDTGHLWFGSGFLLSENEHLYLVTARHVANDTSTATQLIYRSPTGEPLWVALWLVRNDDNCQPWVHHETADVSTMLIATRRLSPQQIADLTALAISREALTREIPKRTTPIEVTGFPLSLGTLGSTLSPIVVQSALASREISFQEKWGLLPTLLAAPAIGRGTSGGPVFVSQADETKVELLGLYSGVIFDDTGSKLAQIVPARFIAEIVDQAEKKSSEAKTAQREDTLRK